MLIIDAHLDLSWNALQWNRDLTRSVHTIRTQENTAQGKGRHGSARRSRVRRGRPGRKRRRGRSRRCGTANGVGCGGLGDIGRRDRLAFYGAQRERVGADMREVGLPDFLQDRLLLA